MCHFVNSSERVSDCRKSKLSMRTSRIKPGERTLPSLIFTFACSRVPFTLSLHFYAKDMKGQLVMLANAGEK